jgi:IS1 family transposase/transposase-like protein
MLPIYACFSHDLLLLLCFWLLFNHRAIWEIIVQARQKPKRGGTGRSRPSSDPKFFPGLTKKPVCQACEQERGQSKDVPEPPPLMSLERGRPAQIDSSKQFCPYQDCRYYGWLRRGNIIANGHPSGGVWRQFYCKACGRWFLETHGTLFFGRRQVIPVLLMVIAALVEGMGIRAASRVFGLDPNTVQSWLVTAAEQLSAFAAHFLVELEPEQVQLDEVFAPLAHLLESDSELVEFNHGSNWLWTAMDPVTKLLLVVVVGKRSLTVAQEVVHQVKQRLAVDGLPVFLTDGLAHYKTAILTHFGYWTQPTSVTAEASSKPRWFPLPDLLYAQVIKRVRGGRLVRVKQRLIFGDRAQLQARLEQWGWKINTAFVERLNLTIRHHIAALGRRVLKRAQAPVGLGQQVVLFLVYYNFCLEHNSLRLSLAESQPTRGNGSLKKWQKRTPAMAAGLTDHIWSLREVLLYRVPPWPQVAAKA